MHDDDGHVLGGQGEPSYDEHDDDGHVLGGQGEPSYDEHDDDGHVLGGQGEPSYDGQMTRSSHRTPRDPVGHSG